MVTQAVPWHVLAEGRRPLILELDPQDRVRALTALGLVILLGAVLLLLAWWGARVTRRYMHREPAARSVQKPRPIREDDWADKPLYPDDEEPS